MLKRIFCGCFLEASNKDALNPVKSLTKSIPFVPPITEGEVISVYDGDTITIASVLPNTTEPIYRFSIRLNGIDTPEIKGQHISEDEKEAAKLERKKARESKKAGT